MLAATRPELSMGWVDLRTGLGWVGLGWVGSSVFAFWWVGFGRGSEVGDCKKLKPVCFILKPVRA